MGFYVCLPAIYAGNLDIPFLKLQHQHSLGFAGAPCKMVLLLAAASGSIELIAAGTCAAACTRQGRLRRAALDMG